jgi:DNA-binding transcriptional MocR family regulator
MFLISLDRDSAEPLSRQIVRAVVEGIGSGALRPGDSLPATRSLAEELGISRSTAQAAYEELWAEGYTESRPGSATRVRDRSRAGSAPPSGKEGGARLESRISPGLAACLSEVEDILPPPSGLASPSPPGCIDFSRLNLDPRLYPVEDFRKALDSVLRSRGGEALSYGNPAGDARLREAIARRMSEHGVLLGPESVVLTDGALHGLDLVLRLLCPPGGSFLCESPTFSGALGLARCSGLRPLGVAMDGEGILPGEILARHRRARSEGLSPALLYTVPSYHNPTGSMAGRRRREAVLEACAGLDLPIVEDCFEEEIGFSGRFMKSIASMDGEGRVVYLGTFSKVLFPGMRLGWLAASPAFAARAAQLRAATGVAGNGLIQASLAGLIESGAFESHVKRINRVFSRRLEAAMEAFEREVPGELARLRPPAGGYLLWVELLAGRGGLAGAGPGARRQTADREAAVMEACVRRGLLVRPGRAFWPEAPGGAFLRLSIAGSDEGEIREGMVRLGAAIEEAR